MLRVSGRSRKLRNFSLFLSFPLPLREMKIEMESFSCFIFSYVDCETRNRDFFNEGKFAHDLSSEENRLDFAHLFLSDEKSIRGISMNLLSRVRETWRAVWRWCHCWCFILWSHKSREPHLSANPEILCQSWHTINLVICYFLAKKRIANSFDL